MPSAAPRSIAVSQCARRSRPAAVSDQGREPFSFGAHSSTWQPPDLDSTAPAHTAKTISPSDLRMPLQLVRSACSHTPRAWKARVRGISRARGCAAAARRALFQDLRAQLGELRLGEALGVGTQLEELLSIELLHAVARPRFGASSFDNRRGNLHGPL